jgi:hypothetical protein
MCALQNEIKMINHGNTDPLKEVVRLYFYFHIWLKNKKPIPQFPVFFF